MGSSVSDIQVSNINEELTRLWDQEQGQDKTRASLFNLIVYIQGKERLDYFQKLIKTVVSKFPSRVIFIVMDNDPKEEYLRTSVSSENVGEGDLQLFCEMIQIEAAGKLRERIPFLIIPQILAELPVHLLWTEDPSTENAILPLLEPYAQRVIFDSQSTHNLQEFAHNAHALMHRFNCDVGDLNWSGISGWRSLFAQTFDSKETFYGLSQCHHITINYNASTPGSHAEIKAIYFQAWLASRLNWEFQALEMIEGNIRLVYRSSMQEVVVILHPKQDPALDVGEILSVEMKSALHQGEYHFARNAQTKLVTIQFSDDNKCDLPISGFLQGAEAGQEIIDEIFYPASKQHYQSMLEVLAKTPWKI